MGWGCRDGIWGGCGVGVGWGCREGIWGGVVGMVYRRCDPEEAAGEHWGQNPRPSPTCPTATRDPRHTRGVGQRC